MYVQSSVADVGGRELARCPEGDKAAIFKYYKDFHVKEGKGRELGKGAGI